MRLLASVLVVACLVLAGCGHKGNGGGPTSTSSTGSPSGFDGEAALAFVEQVVTRDDGSPAFRVPGTDAHREASVELRDLMQVGTLTDGGWHAGFQNFTGADYAALDKGEASVYFDSSTYCSAEDRARLAGLEFSNLIALRRPSGPSVGTLILGAHWESKAEASSDPDPAKRSQPVLGANDGASGVGVLLQLMRELDGVELPYAIQVVFFDGEDGFEDCHPLAGSLWFVEQLRQGDAMPLPSGAEPAQRRLLLLDMVGDPDARFVREEHSTECDPALVDLLHELAPEHGLADNFPGTRRSVQDDHVPFTEAGIPAVDLIDFGRGFPPYWHTTNDTMENLDAGMLGRVGGLVLAAMQHPSFVDEWPGAC